MQFLFSNTVKEEHVARIHRSGILRHTEGLAKAFHNSFIHF